MAAGIQRKDLKALLIEESKEELVNVILRLRKEKERWLKEKQRLEEELR